MSKLYLVLWPSFWVAALAEFLFITIIDPKDLYLFGQPVHFSNLATNSFGFIAFWVICAASSYATLFFLRNDAVINRVATSNPPNNMSDSHTVQP